MRRKHVLLAGIVSILVFAFVGCDNPAGSGSGNGTGNGSPSPAVTNVTVSPTVTVMEKGTTRTFSATVTAVHGAAETVNWTVTGDSGIHALTAFSPTTSVSGQSVSLFVAADEPSATLTVRATSTQDSARFHTATVTLVAPETPFVSDIAITNAPLNVERGWSTLPFSATVTTHHGASNNVNWTVTRAGGGPVQAGTAISPSTSASGGNVTLNVAFSEPMEQLTVRAASAINSDIYREVTITVLPTASFRNTLTLSGNVYYESGADWFSRTFPRFNGGASVHSNPPLQGGESGAITGGQLAFSIGVPTAGLESALNALNRVVEDNDFWGWEGATITTTPANTQGVRLRLETSGFRLGEIIREFTTISGNIQSIWNSTMDTVLYIYVTQDTRFQSAGRSVIRELDGIPINFNTETFDFTLRTGWNAVHWRNVLRLDSSNPSNPTATSHQTLALNDPQGLRWTMTGGEQ